MSTDVTYLVASTSGPDPYSFAGGTSSTFTARVGALAFVPEPSTVALMAAALGLLCTMRRGDARRAGTPAAAPALAAA